MAGTQQKKISATMIGAWTGAVLGILALSAYATGMLDKKIDERCQYNNRYITILLKEIATPDQKKRADEEFARWNK